MKTLRIFVSSPGDVAEERALAQRVIERLRAEVAGRLDLQAILWENEPLLATSTFQDQIVRPSDCDIVVTVLWSRLGTQLPAHLHRPDGTAYASGTEFEFEDALESFRQKGHPKLLVYRKTAEPRIQLSDEAELLTRLDQKKCVEAFFQKWFHDEKDGSLKAAFHPFRSVSEFEDHLERHLHRLVEAELPPAGNEEEGRVSWSSGSPFRGLEAFDVEHAPVFFGRTPEIVRTVDRLRSGAEHGCAFVLVLGMSGGGKSSLARAGVLPMLMEPGVVPGVSTWRYAVVRPGSSREALRNLAEGWTSALPELTLPAAELATVLGESPTAALALVEAALVQIERDAKGDHGRSGRANLILVVDQMEELFTADDETTEGEEQTAEERMQALDRFVECLDRLARSGRAWVMATLRSDFYSKFATVPRLAALKGAARQVDLAPPSAAAIGRMIRQPARAAGLRFEEQEGHRLDDLLQEAAAASPETLPLLQFTLEALYERRTDAGLLTLAAYEELGGLEGALTRRAESTLTNLPPDVATEAPGVFRELVVIRDGIVARRGAPRAGLSAHSFGREIVDAFVADRLLLVETNADGESVVRIVHEALLRRWPRLVGWIRDSEELLRIRERVVAAADRWEQQNRPEDLLLHSGKPLGEARLLLSAGLDLTAATRSFVIASATAEDRRRWMKRAVLAALVVLTLLASAAAWRSTRDRDRAQEERGRAEAARQEAEQVAEFFVDLFEIEESDESGGGEITARELLDRGAERLDREFADEPLIQARFKSAMGLVYMNLGLYPLAEQFMGEALALREEYLPHEHLDLATSLDELGVLLARKSDFDAARPLIARGLAIRIAAFGEQHEQVAYSLTSVGDVEYDTGQLGPAWAAYSKALAIHRAASDEQGIATLLNRMGLVETERGREPEAEALIREALAILRHLHGPNHPEVAPLIHNLAGVARDSGRPEEAIELYRQTLAIEQRFLGLEHPETAITLISLADVLRQQGEFDEAQELIERALAIQEAAFGADGRLVAQTVLDLGNVLHDLGRPEASAAAAERALNIRGKDSDLDPVVARAEQLLGEVALDAGRPGDAVPRFERAATIFGAVYGEDDSERVAALNSLESARKALADSGANNSASGSPVG